MDRSFCWIRGNRQSGIRNLAADLEGHANVTLVFFSVCKLPVKRILAFTFLCFNEMLMHLCPSSGTNLGSARCSTSCLHVVLRLEAARIKPPVGGMNPAQFRKSTQIHFNSIGKTWTAREGRAFACRLSGGVVFLCFFLNIFVCIFFETQKRRAHDDAEQRRKPRSFSVQGC